MYTRSLMRSFIVVVALLGMSACAGFKLSATEQAIDPPPTVTATPVTDTQIAVSWTAVPDAFKYFIFQQTNGSGDFVFAGTVLAPDTSRVVLNLTPSTLYSYRIVSVGNDGSESAPSDPPVSATTFAVAPGAPTNVVATAVSAFEIDLSWTASPTATKYYVFESQAGGAFQFRASVLTPDTTYAATNLLPNTQYCYQLVSQLPDGSQSGASTPDACATTGGGPTPPTSVTATAITDTRILVQWQPAADASKYNVYQSQSGGPFTFHGSLLASQQSFLDVNLTPTTEYCYRVTTVLSNNVESAQSGSSCATTFAAGGGGFQGYWKLDERGGGTALDSSGFDLHGTIAGASYELSDRPQIDDDRSAISFTSSPASAITVPPAPGFDLLGNFTVAFWAKLPAAADVTFVGMRGAGCGPLGWEIAQDSASGLHFAGQTQVVTAGTSIPVGVWTHVAVTSADGTMHVFVNGVETSSGAFTPDNTQSAPLGIGHVAGCAGGAVLMDDVQIVSRALSSAEVGVLGTLPPAPVNLVVSSKTSVSVNLSWDPVPGATAYIISKGTAAGNEAFFTHSPATPTFQGDHLTPSTQSSWTVRAVVNHLFSNPSNEAIATTDPAPAAPANVTAAVVTPDRIQVDWSPVPGAFKYLVFMSTSGGPFVFAGSLVAPSTSFLAVNLSPATTYAFQVQAEDAVQTQGPMSLPASATTP
jgi:fibronectin type 3 domain-containing protein